MSDTKRKMFIGTYACAVCSARVRVYDWLPEAVLCRKCQAQIGRAERDPEEEESTK